MADIREEGKVVGNSANQNLEPVIRRRVSRTDVTARDRLSWLVPLGLIIVLALGVVYAKLQGEGRLTDGFQGADLGGAFAAQADCTNLSVEDCALRSNAAQEGWFEGEFTQEAALEFYKVSDNVPGGRYYVNPCPNELNCYEVHGAFTLTNPFPNGWVDGQRMVDDKTHIRPTYETHPERGQISFYPGFSGAAYAVTMRPWPSTMITPEQETFTEAMARALYNLEGNPGVPLIWSGTHRWFAPSTGSPWTVVNRCTNEVDGFTATSRGSVRQDYTDARLRDQISIPAGATIQVEAATLGPCNDQALNEQYIGWSYNQVQNSTVGQPVVVPTIVPAVGNPPAVNRPTNLATCQVTPLSGLINTRVGAGKPAFNTNGSLQFGNVAAVDASASGTDGFVWYRITNTNQWVRSDVVTTPVNCTMQSYMVSGNQMVPVNQVVSAPQQYAQPQNQQQNQPTNNSQPSAPQPTVPPAPQPTSVPAWDETVARQMYNIVGGMLSCDATTCALTGSVTVTNPLSCWVDGYRSEGAGGETRPGYDDPRVGIPPGWTGQVDGATLIGSCS